ncbi:MULTISPECIES: ABC transporter ATP-binding protein [unclassified Chamaesiphon]|uniref:ABC transporter ATP-binding protein n=1 Tax=unclassified Chamaesiphon TaxID=2620921 RepID=UPI00286B0447|nr:MULTISPECIES: ABC transporter ATP-binding protein [unclassified Chamaesiphon]
MLDLPGRHLQSQSENKEVLIRVENVSKKFCRSLKKSLWYGIKDIGLELTGRKYEHELRADEFWSVKDISFELRRGECLGLIGRNGAGKTTLLRMLNGLIKPDRGSIEINGQVGGLIALGAGFNPILTGRENIYVNGSILGLSKAEIDAKFEEIIEFAELGEFIDAPVQTYSSGMSVRLGFAVAVVLIKPDVLLLDEVLAVGDMGFVLKCFRKIDLLIPNCAVIFVSHSMPQVSRIATDIALLEKGKPVYQGKNVSEGIDIFYSKFDIIPSFYTDNLVQITNILINGQPSLGQTDSILVERLSDFEIEVNLNVDRAFRNPEPYLVFYDAEQRGIAEYFYEEAYPLENITGIVHFKILIPKIIFSKGLYSITVGLNECKGGPILMRAQSIVFFQVKAEKNVWTAFQLDGELTQIG